MSELENFEEYFAKRWMAKLMQKGMSKEEAEAEAWRRVEQMHVDLIKRGGAL